MDVSANDARHDNNFPVERRTRERVIDAVGLEIWPVDAGGQSAEESDGRSADPAVGLQRGAVPVINLRKYDIPGYPAVQQHYPAVADYIGELEALVLKFVQEPAAETGGRSSHSRPNRKISLSASGLAFGHTLLLQPGDLVWVALTLFPENIEIRCQAEINGIGDAGKLAAANEHTYRAVFRGLTIHQELAIERHIQKLLKATRPAAGHDVASG